MSRRFSFVAGWAAVALLAIVGFAAFNASDDNPEALQAEAAAASMGHTAGAYAGLSFALLGQNDKATTAVVVEQSQPESAQDSATGLAAASESDPTGTIATAASGWLSEVEVRALVEQYFEPEDVNRAVRIAWCESRFDPNATDLRTGGRGLFNHLPRYWEERARNAGFSGADIDDAEASTAAAAWEVYNGAGWEIFNCR